MLKAAALLLVKAAEKTNGYKTVTGLGIVLLGISIKAAGLSFGDELINAGAAIAAVGIGHKIEKWRKKKNG